jgi:putative sigma-54 modulation protein
MVFKNLKNNKGFKMNTSIIGKNIDLTDGIKSAIEGCYDSFSKYSLDIISVKTIITCEDKNKRYCVEFLLNISHNNSVIIKQYGKDTYNAIDEASSRVHKKLRKIHEIETDHKGVSLGELLSIDMDENIKDVINVDIKKENHNLELIDAMNILKETKDQYFLVYTDKENKIRVVYKRMDGNIGLY